MCKKTWIFVGIFISVTSFFVYGDEETSFTRQQYLLIDKDNISSLDTNLPFVEIIGWSKNGLVAYRYITKGDETGLTKYHFVILNTVNDKYIERDSMNLFEPEDYYDEKDEREKKKTYDEYKTKWNALLEKHSIIGKINDPLEEIKQNNAIKFPLGDFNCWFDYTMKPDETWYKIFEWKLIIGNNRIQKVINTATEKLQADTLGRKIIGYYKSPYENRIVIVVNNYGLYYRDTYLVNLYGCNMDVGLH